MSNTSTAFINLTNAINLINAIKCINLTNAILKSQVVFVNINALWTNMNNNQQNCLLTLTKINKLCNNYVK